MVQRVRIVVLVVAVFASLACHRGSDEARLNVAAASSLAPAFDEIAAAFRTRTGGQVSMIYGATGVLARQIEHGAPIDVFASADRDTPMRLVGRGLISSGAVAPFAHGALVIFARSDATVHPATLAELRGVAGRIAIANPEHAPYGRAAREALVRAVMWNELAPRIVMGENVEQAYQFAATGNADVAITARSVVLGRAGYSVPVDPALYAPIENDIAVVAASHHAAAGRAFVAFVHGAEARAILSRHGLDPAER